MTASSLTLGANGLEFSATGAGPADGELVLCLHGFPDTPSTFRNQITAFADAGFTVVAPRLRGYEPSSQPADGDHGLMALAADVIGWLDDLGVEQAHLVGHDWGAVIAYVVAAHHPHRVHTATALAIPPLARIPSAVRRLPRQLARSWYMTFFQIPKLADQSLQARHWKLMRRLWRTWSPGYTMAPEEWAELETTFEQPGVVASALAYYRQNATPPIMLGLRHPPAMSEATITVPTLIVNGSDDACMDRRLFALSIHDDDFPAGVEHVEVSGAGHFLHLEQPELVNELILRHLS
ncbi:MAG: alpha/beta hydrolase [Actinomycetia bacterium]|nr:alpha/beta hydrolase [Actinomycetes bacterium]